MTSITSTALPPNPPCSSANGTPSNPISANAPHTFSLHPLSESTILARASSAYSFARYRLRLSASSCCSSLRSKFIPMLLARAEFRHRDVGGAGGGGGGGGGGPGSRSPPRPRRSPAPRGGPYARHRWGGAAGGGRAGPGGSRVPRPLPGPDRRPPAGVGAACPGGGQGRGRGPRPPPAPPRPPPAPPDIATTATARA